MNAAVIVNPTDAVPDLSTRGTLLRFARLRAAGFTRDHAQLLADAGYDVIGYALLPQGES